MTGSVLVRAALIGAVTFAAACGRTTPVEPAAALAAASGSGRSARVGAAEPVAGDVLYPLIGGSFVIDSARGARIIGSYAGTALIAVDGPQTASMTFQITGGSGVFEGAQGTLSLSGTGAFADEGELQLEGRGEVTLAGGNRTHLKLNLRGTSRATCSAAERILISQTAAGTLARAGRVIATLSHEVGGTGCSS